MPANFTDAYLKNLVTADIRTRAYIEVDLYGTFTDEWRDRVVVPQAYVLVCLENQADAEDLFTAKLKTYQKELDRVVVRARNATPDDEGLITPIFGIPMERS